MDGCSFSASFTAKPELVFVLRNEKAFSLRFHFTAKRKCIDSSKNGTSDFQNSPPFERSACFYVTITECFEKTFNTFNLQEIF